MDYNFAAMLEKIMIMIVPAILAITFHEAAHAYAARRLGDDTAYRLGRTSLNPAVHIDPIGTILLPIITMMIPGGFFFGYAKPVPVIASRLNNPRLDMPKVALAGPVANLVMAVCWAIVLAVTLVFGHMDSSGFIHKVASFGVLFNLILFAFNMLPILPLDGGRILQGLLPPSLGNSFAKLEPYGMMIVLLLAFATGNLLYKVWLGPIMAVLETILNSAIIRSLVNILGG